MKKAKWTTESGLKRKIDSYFKECEKEEKPATKISLAVYLGLTKEEFLKMAFYGQRRFPKVPQRL